MQLVVVIEAKSGHPVEAWPTSILTIIFAFDPYMPLALTQLEKVIAFFYGHNVPVIMECQFFAACSFFLLHLANNPFKYFCTQWPQYPLLGGDCMYYNLNERRFKNVDGTYVEEFDDVIPSFGYEATGFPSIARNILLQANQKEYEEGDV